MGRVTLRKPCIHCGKYFDKPASLSKRVWPARQFCTQACRLDYLHVDPPNPSGLCECGCGGTTPISKFTHRPKGLAAGEHVRFIPGHNLGPKFGAANGFYGRKHSEQSLQRMREVKLGKRTGAAQPNWKGDEVGYHAAHAWLDRHYSHEKTACEECGATERMFHWAYQGPPGGYSRDRGDYRVFCVSCHRKFDYAQRRAA